KGLESRLQVWEEHSPNADIGEQAVSADLLDVLIHGAGWKRQSSVQDHDGDPPALTSKISPQPPTSAISIPAAAQRGARRSARRCVPSVWGTTATWRPGEATASRRPTVSQRPL